MKTKYIKLLSVVFCFFLSMNTFAEGITVGCLNFSFQGNNAIIIGYDENSIPANLVIPETVTYNGLTFSITGIADKAFMNCSKIQSLSMTKSLAIGESAFKQCNNLVSINIITTSISPYAFQSCGNLETVTLHNVVDIYNDAFSYCPKIRWIDFGNNLKRLGSGAFRQCSLLTYLVLPATISYICRDQYYSSNHYTSMGDASYWGNNAPTTQYPLYEHTYSPFSECPYIQNVIYLGNVVSTYISNVNVYQAIKQVNWSNTSFDYQGKAPTVTFTNDMPAGFEVKAYAEPTLEKDVGTYTQNMTFTFANNDMSFDVEIPYEYTINPVTLKAKVKDASRLYGDADPDFSSTYTGFVNNEDASVVTSHGSYTTTATAKSDVGTYAIKQTGAIAQNYVFEYEDGILTVNMAPLTMTANDKTMTYGGTTPTFDAKYEGLKNNETQPVWTTEPSFSTTATSASKVGTYPITISDADAKNYQLTVNGGTMTVEKAELTVSADNKSRIYGDVNPEFTLTYTGLKNSETVPEWEKKPTVETTADAKSNVGTYPISIKDAVAVNYNITAIDGTLTINKAALQITPKDATRKYGEENPKFELSYSGLKNSESVPEWTTDPVITTNATKESSVGEYSIQVASAEAKNYTLEKKVGTLIVTKAPLSVGVNSCNRKYGETNPTFELYYEGLLNNETAPEWTKLPTITTEADAKSDVGEYAIEATDGEMKNYETSKITSGVLTITPASLTIKANNVSRLYFEENPEFFFICTGFVVNDDESVLTVKPKLRTDAVKDSNVGVYPIEIGDAESKNYTISYVKGQLTINKRQLTVSTKDYTRAYGEENPAFEMNYSGFVNNENEKVLLSKPKIKTDATSNSDVGTYSITIDNGVAENYDFNYVNGKLTIEKAYQTLTWDQVLSDVKQYDQVELTATASSGLEVTYSIEGSRICSIVKTGVKQYIDSNTTGESVISAVQPGNKNYWPTTKQYKQILIKPLPSIKGDVNNDGVVNAVDVVTVTNIIMGTDK